MSAATHPLLRAVSSTLSAVAPDQTSRAYERLSVRYRDELDTDPMISSDEVAAYGLARLPATLASVVRVLDDVRQILPTWRPSSTLDLGAGLGTAGWAAAVQFPSLQRVTFVERAPEMARLGAQLAATSELETIRKAEWLGVRQSAMDLSSEHADLVLASYVYGELPADSREEALRRWWKASDDILVVVEPGTPSGSQRLLDARRILTAEGAHVIAPCPSGIGCAEATGWCHFSARVQRSAVHRLAKGATLGYEDEKFAYLVLSRREVEPNPIVTKDPEKRSGHVRLELCSTDGHATTVVSKRDGALYRWARGARWGDREPGEESEGLSPSSTP